MHMQAFFVWGSGAKLSHGGTMHWCSRLVGLCGKRRLPGVLGRSPEEESWGVVLRRSPAPDVAIEGIFEPVGVLYGMRKAREFGFFALFVEQRGGLRKNFFFSISLLVSLHIEKVLQLTILVIQSFLGTVGNWGYSLLWQQFFGIATFWEFVFVLLKNSKYSHRMAMSGKTLVAWSSNFRLTVTIFGSWVACNCLNREMKIEFFVFRSSDLFAEPRRI